MRSSLSVELREPKKISLHSDSRLFTSGFYKLFMTHRFLATPIARPSEASSIYPGRKCGMYRKVLAHCISHRDKPFYYVLFAMLLKWQSALTQHREKIVSQPKSIKENPQEKVQKRARNKVRLHTTYYIIPLAAADVVHILYSSTKMDNISNNVKSTRKIFERKRNISFLSRINAHKSFIQD